MDSQVVEVLGRSRLTSELMLAGIEVALPVRDRGIDLVAYIDLAADNSSFLAVPIQMKAASRTAFSVDRKYEKVSNLVIAYVWGLRSQEDVETYALTYEEALAVAEEMGWTKTASWERGSYVTSQPGKKLRGLLAPFRMTSEAWRAKIARVAGSSPDSSLAPRGEGEIGPAEIAKLTAFLPVFTSPGFSPVLKWSGGEKLPDGSFPWRHPEYDPAVLAFFNITAMPPWTDTNYVPEQAAAMLRREHAVATASMADIRAMLTFCTRGEHWGAGHWAAMIENGYVQRLLKRLLQYEP